MTTFKPNSRADEELRREPAIRAKLSEVAGELRDLVGARAKPIMPRRGREIAEVVHEDGKVYVALTAHGAHFDEFGSRNNPPYAPMRRSIDSLGLRLEQAPKS